MGCGHCLQTRAHQFLDRQKPISRPSKKAVFLFLYFLKTFFTEIYFRFHILQFYTPTPGRGAAGGLHVNKYNFFCAEAPDGSLPPPCRAAGTCRPVEGRQVARPPSRGWQAPPLNIKAEPLPSHPHFLPTRSREGRGREEG